MHSPALHLVGGHWIGSEDKRPVSDPIDGGRVGAVAFALRGGTKQSVIGRESSSVGLEEFTVTRYLAIGI